MKKGSAPVVDEHSTSNANIQEYTFNDLTPGQQYTLSLYSETYNNVRSLAFGTVDATVSKYINLFIVDPR